MRILNSMEEGNDNASNPSVTNPTNSNKFTDLDEEIEDLEDKDEQNLNLQGANLNLINPDRYFIGPKTIKHSMINDNHSLNDLKLISQQVFDQSMNWSLDIKKV
jgi:hypothetical protein